VVAGKFHLEVSLGAGERMAVERAPERTAILAAFPTAFLLTVMSVVGILHDGTYSRETQNWAAQAIGQDWVDLLFGAPWLVMTAVGALRRSRPARILLAGGLLYTVYELLIYAFAVHFNVLFLVYCATLGLSLFALLGVGLVLAREDVRGWFEDSVPVRVPGVFLIAVGAGFSLLWLAEVIPALVRGTIPASVAEAGVLTNPVQVIDLSVVLPVHIAAGVLLLRHRRFGFMAAPIVLAFGVLMALSIAGMMVVMHLRAIETTLPVAIAMGGLSFATGTILVLMLRKLRPSS
jgi:hypothetical protein